MAKKPKGPPLGKLVLHKRTKGKKDNRPELPPGAVYFESLALADYLRMAPGGELMTKSHNKGRGVCHGPALTARPEQDTPVWPAELDGFTNSVVRDIAMQGRLHDRS